MISEWMDLAVLAAFRAGSRIVELYAGEIEIQHKQDHSPVTTADRQAHTIIQSHLLPSGIPILSEEGCDIPHDRRRLWRYFWLVDPLDGTKEFLKRNDEFTVNIALIENDRPIAGVVYAPALGRLYFGQLYIGSYKWIDVPKRLEQSQERLRLDDMIGEAQKLPAPRGPRPFTIAGSRSHATPALEDYLNRMRAAKNGSISFPPEVRSSSAWWPRGWPINIQGSDPRWSGTPLPDRPWRRLPARRCFNGKAGFRCDTIKNRC